MNPESTIVRRIRKGLLAGTSILLLTAFIGLGWVVSDRRGAGITPVGDIWFTIANGLLSDWSVDRKFGKNSAVGATYEGVTDQSEAYEFQTDADYYDIISSDANDSGVAQTDTGAYTLFLAGLDSDFNPITETVTLTGDTTVTTAQQFRRLNRAYVVSCGTYGGTNEGNITIASQTDSDTVGYIAAGEGQTRQAVYTVPAGYTAYIRRITLSAASNKTVEFRGRIRLSGDDTTVPASPWRTVFEHVGISAPFTFLGEEFNEFPGKTDIIIECKAASTADASAAYGILLKAD